jgi:2,3-bisphosphoglycerate-dependent phosphoglycerate mutase
MQNLILLRHGQSAWNQANQFTGWTDVDLTGQGIVEAHRAGRFLREAGVVFDVAYTSLLKRSIRTLWLVLDEIDLMWVPVEMDWRLNERHYGALQGLNKGEIADRYGTQQVFLWRRSFTVRPPALDADDPRHPQFDARYSQIDPLLLPATESLKDTFDRVMACWEQDILPCVRQGKRVLVVAHGNSLRALIKHLDSIPDEDVAQLNIPTAIPIVYELDEGGLAVRRSYLGDPAVVRAAVENAEKAAQVKGRSGT